MADIAEVVKSYLQRKSKFVKIKNQLPHYTINEFKTIINQIFMKIYNQIKLWFLINQKP